MVINQNEIKQRLRQTMRTQRNALSPEQVQAYSQLVWQKLDGDANLNTAQVIMGFYSIKNEVDIMPWLIHAKSLGKTILLPRVESMDEMAAVEFTGWEYTQKSKMGIVEPLGVPFPIDNIDAVLVPGLVFDKCGYRLGYGRGYYDRFLPGLKKSAYIYGICYDFQIAENVWPHSLDIPVQKIFSA